MTDCAKCPEHCVFSAFPLGCNRFLPPLSRECLSSIWSDAGCEKKGQGYPGVLGHKKFSVLAGMNLT